VIGRVHQNSHQATSTNAQNVNPQNKSHQPKAGVNPVGNLVIGAKPKQALTAMAFPEQVSMPSLIPGTVI